MILTLVTPVIAPEGWTIEYNPKPIKRIGDWDFWHENHDGENGLFGMADSKADALEQIKEIEDDRNN